MPRNPGTGVYIAPIPNAIPNTTIASLPYNTNFRDVETDLNQPRPIVAGGTGAVNADQALLNLSGEKANQVVANYNSFVFMSGSFASAAGASGAPTGDPYAGICYAYGPPDYLTIEARLVTSAPGAAPLYVRQKVAGVWGAWALADQAATDLASSKLAKSGDTMTGALSVTMADPVIVLNKASGTGGHGDYILGRTNDVNRWNLGLGDGGTESGGDVGSNFSIYRYNDLGTLIDSPLTITRATGCITTIGLSVLPSGTSDITGTYAEGTLHIGYVNYGSVYRPTQDASAFPAVFVNSANTLVGFIQTTATVTSYTTVSDARMKEDIKALAVADAAAVIDNTQVCDFRWRGSSKRAFGVIAQQANEVYPAAVSYIAGADAWGVDYSKYVPVLLAELQALRARVAQLETMLTVPQR